MATHAIDGRDLEDFRQAQRVIAGIIDYCNHRRLHSSWTFLRPLDRDRGDPATLLAERPRKRRAARELRKPENLKLRQRLIPWPETENVA